MYVLLEAARNVMLPYQLAKGVQQVFTFVPGKNKIDDAIWKKIIEQNENDYRAHHAKLLHPFETGFDTGTKAHLDDYSEQEMLEIVAGVHNPEFLEYLLHNEHERKFDFAPRNSVIGAIKSRLPQRQMQLDELNALGNQMREYAPWLS